MYHLWASSPFIAFQIELGQSLYFIRGFYPVEAIGQVNIDFIE